MDRRSRVAAGSADHACAMQLAAQNLEDQCAVTSCAAKRGDCFIGQGRTIATGSFYTF